jgi:hypothetical protein
LTTLGTLDKSAVRLKGKSNTLPKRGGVLLFVQRNKGEKEEEVRGWKQYNI